MTLAEAHDVRALLAELFPAGRVDPAPAGTLVDELGDLPAAMAVAAVRSLARTGREWVPSPSQIRAHVLHLALDLPDWGAVIGTLHAQRREQARPGRLTRWECPHGECAGDGVIVDEETRTASWCRCRPEVLAARQRRGVRHPALAAWFDATPAAKIDQALDGDTTAEAQLRESWRDWCRDLTSTATHRGLDPAGLPAIERAAAGRPQRDALTRSTAMGDLVRSLRPAHELEAGSEAA